MMQTLATTIEAKDEYTRGHSYRVAEYAALIAKELGWSQDEITNLKHAANRYPGFCFKQTDPTDRG